MTNGQIRDLCLALLHADTETEVIEVLKKAGYWDKPAAWRYYGDVENNWGQSGNQQSLAEAALAEKLVNSVDARLINECLVRGIDPKSDKAPPSITDAVARFFDGETGKKQTSGRIENWTDDRIREVAQGITLAATGTRPTLNLTITDAGEGQSPRRLPNTILSLNRANKMYIKFVQGQFNQGGTGALRFCGTHNLQLVISRRNQALLGPDPDERDKEWGFTIVRRERASEATDGRRNSIFSFLAPVGVGKEHEPRHGDVLSFTAASMPIFPDDSVAYGREASFGTAIKLYEYQYIGERSNIIFGKRVILRRLELLLPEIALPVRLYEFRQNAAGKVLPKGSRETTLVGLRRRLIDNPNVEDGFPIQLNFSPEGQKFIAEVYVFKPEGTERDTGDDDDDEDNGKDRKKLGGIKSYRKREGVVFVRNGQTQGHLPRDFFKRESLKLKPLAEDMLVLVDCDQMSDDVREDLFMPSRDRLTDNAFKAKLVDGLDQALKTDDTLKQLRNKRQQERISEQLKDDRPLTAVLQSLIKSSPNLTQLLQLGQRLSAPFNTMQVASSAEKEFKGELYPTFFKVKNVEYGKLYKRGAPINQRMKFTFETDARDDYFLRRIERGDFSLVYIDKKGIQHNSSYVGPSLKRGISAVMANLPEEAEVGDVIKYVARTEDAHHTFENVIEVTVKPAVESHSGGTGTRKPPQNKPGNQREIPRQLSTPKIERIYREDWEKQKPPFDEHTALRVEVTGYEGEDENEVYEFRINMDNMPLLNEIKQRRIDDGPARNQFLYGNVLIGLSLLLQYKQSPTKDAESKSIEARIEQTTRALAPFMLALTSLAQHDLSDVEEIDGLEAATG